MSGLLNGDTAPQPRRIRLKSAADVEKSLEKCLRLSIIAFEEKPRESGARTICALAAQLQKAREAGSLNDRLAKLEKKMGVSLTSEVADEDLDALANRIEKYAASERMADVEEWEREQGLSQDVGAAD